MKDFLEASNQCDIGHPAIQAKAKELRSAAGDPTETLVNTYNYVRDEISFSVESFRLKASEVMALGKGACQNKSVLMATLLRANNIPAGFLRQGLAPQSMLAFFPEEGLKYGGDPFAHQVCVANVDDRWIKVDTTWDLDLLKLAGRDYWEMAKPWDGKSDRQMPDDVVLMDVGEPFGALPEIGPEADAPPALCALMNAKVVELRAQ